MALLDDVNLGALAGDDPQKQIESLAKQVTEQARLISNEDKTKIFKDTSGTPRVLLGEGADGFYGLKVSQEGNDVYTADDGLMVFNSNQNMFKIVDKDTATIPSFTSGTSQANYSSVTIPHGQSYTPIVKVFVEGYIVDASISLVASSYVPLPITVSSVIPANYYFPNDAGSPSYRAVGIVYAVDDTNIYIQASTTTTGTAFTMLDIPVTYYIMQETIA